ncbi:MAG: hypothetical protein ACR2OZ_11610 [Verrucomicrobiales bacterium]
MKNPSLLMLAVGATSFSSLQAVTFSTFSGVGDTPVTLQTFGSPPGPSIDPNGGATGVGDAGLVVTPAVNGQNNYAVFDGTDTGTFTSSSFNFQFKVGLGTTPGTADGVSFAYLPTATYGTTGSLVGPVFGAAEDPAALGVLGIGLDTWSNQGAFDDPAQPTGSNYSEVSLFYDNVLISRVNDTRLLVGGFAIDNGDWHTASGVVDYLNDTVTMDIDGVVMFAAVPVPGLASVESRIAFAGRTGGENEVFNVDNVAVRWIPEPGSAVLGLLGLGLILRRRSVR